MVKGHYFILCQQFSYQGRNGNRNDPLRHYFGTTISPHVCPNQQLLKQMAPFISFLPLKGKWKTEMFCSKRVLSREGGKICIATVQCSNLNYRLSHSKFENYLQFSVLQEGSVTLDCHHHLLPPPLPSNHAFKALGKKTCLLPIQLICITHSWKDYLEFKAKTYFKNHIPNSSYASVETRNKNF